MAGKMRRILLLDFHNNFSMLDDDSLFKRCEFMTFEQIIPNQLSWYPAEFTGMDRTLILRIIEDALKQEPYDLYIIGNNRGAGVEVAKLLPEEARAKTMVTSHVGVGKETEQYKTLGITRFPLREQLPKILTRFVDEGIL